MDYRTTSTVREFRAGVLSLGGWSGAAAMAGQPYGLSRSPVRCAFEAGMSRKPDGGEGTARSSLHPAGPPEVTGASPLLVPTVALLAWSNLQAKALLAVSEALADALDRVR